MQCQPDWFQLYRRAVLEAEWHRVNNRVDVASCSIQAQLRQRTMDAGEKQRDGVVPALSGDAEKRGIQAGSEECRRYARAMI